MLVWTLYIWFGLSIVVAILFGIFAKGVKEQDLSQEHEKSTAHSGQSLPELTK